MKATIHFLALLLPAFVALAQPGSGPGMPLPTGAEGNKGTSDVGIHSDHGYFDGAEWKIVYLGHVMVTNSQGHLACERLTIKLPPENSADNHPTNAVAETNVDVLFVNRTQTNHLTSDRGVYAYSVADGVTNETFTFSGHAKNVGSRGWFTGEPLIWDNINSRFDFGTNFEMHWFVSTNSTSTNSPLPKF